MTKARDLANASTALSAVSATELGYLDGVTSAVQTQLDGKQAANANVSTTELGYLDGVTSAIQTQLNGKQAIVANVSDTEIGYLDGVTSAIQTQLNAKAPLASPTFTGNVTATSFVGYLAGTSLGRSGFGLLVAPAANSQATYSGYPVGYTAMMMPSANGMPNSSHYFYFLKTAQRDNGTGWAGIAINFNSGDLYVGAAVDGTVYATWKKLANEILMGTAAPSGGVDGDVYIQYT
jgi:hypothetical protein